MIDDVEHLHFVAECIEHIDRYVGLDRDLFMSDELVQDAVLRRLEILTDACGKLTEEFRERYQDVPWAQVIGFRNILAHAYRGLDVERAWNVVERGLPQLRTMIAAEFGSA